MFLTELFKYHLDAVSDDPVGVLVEDFQKGFATLERVGADLSIDVWEYWKENSTEFEVARLQLLKKNNRYDKEQMRALAFRNLVDGE